MQTRVDLGPRSYDIAIGHGTLPYLGSFARPLFSGSRAFIVCDNHVLAIADLARSSLQGSGIETALCTFPPGEEQKSLPVTEDIYEFLLLKGADRKSLVVAVGGGVIGDLAGFAAATFLRGLPLLMVPTTLLAMVDSSVGGKVGVNLPKGKNLVGAFHQPLGVWIDTEVLITLPDREYRSGLAEVVKYGVILDSDLFVFLESNAQRILTRESEAIDHIVARCCRLKADVVEKDEREETGLRMILNYGHTCAHAIEAVSGYGKWLHGEAVAAGMIVASKLAEQRGLIGSDLVERQRRLLEIFQLPTATGELDTHRLIGAMRTDKKSLGGKLRFILPRRLGEVVLVDDINDGEIAKVLEISKR